MSEKYCKTYRFGKIEENASNDEFPEFIAKNEVSGRFQPIDGWAKCKKSIAKHIALARFTKMHENASDK